MSFDYSDYANSIGRCFKNHGSIFDMKIINDPYEFLVNLIESGDTILDIGAGRSLPLKTTLENSGKSFVYKSMDSDPAGKFDYRGVEEIPKETQFNCLFGNQVFEHIEVNASLDYLKGLSKSLVPGAKVVLTVPNISHPNRQISNITHITPWGHSGLYFLLEQTGFKVEGVYRYSKRHPQGVVENIFAKVISNLYRMDWCDSVLIYGRKA